MDEPRNERLTPISEVLKDLGSGNTVSPEKKAPEIKLEDCTCQSCGATFQGEVAYYPHSVRPLRPSECDRCKAARVEREAKEYEQDLEAERVEIRRQWRNRCGMPPELLAKTFANFEQRYQVKAYKDALEWANGFDIVAPRGYRSLIFYSDMPGVGKGHLIAGIVNHVIDNWKGGPHRGRCPIRFESGPSLVRRVRATYNIRQDDNTHEREDEVYRALAGVSLLLLDDVGKEKPSDFTRETYWYIIDERVKSGLPVVMSSRLKLEGEGSLEELMGVDTVDRLYGMTRGQVVVMKGSSYRRRKAVP